MKISLINPPVATLSHSSRMVHLPYGLAVLKSFLGKNNIEASIDDLNAVFLSEQSEQYSNKIKKQLLDFYRRQEVKKTYEGFSDKLNGNLANVLCENLDFSNSDLVGVGVNSPYQILSGLLIKEKIRQDYKIPVIFGGPFITLFGEFIFQDKYPIEYAIVGEGEIPLLEFIEHLKGKRSIHKVANLRFIKEGKLFFNGRKSYKAEDQSIADFRGLDLNLYKEKIKGQKGAFIPYMASRGCNSNCTYCAYRKVDGALEFKSIEKVVRELRSLTENYSSRLVRFEDSNLGSSSGYLEDLCDKLIDENLQISWSARIKAKTISKRLIFKMRQSGCFELRYGIESGSDRVLALMQKGTISADQERTLSNAKQAGIRNVINIIVGYPYETAQDLKQTANFIKKNNKNLDWINVYGLTIYPGSILYEQAEKMGIKLKPERSHFYSYRYYFKESRSILSNKQMAEREKSKNRVIAYAYKYVHIRHFKFPLKILVYFFGTLIWKSYRKLIRQNNIIIRIAGAFRTQ
jgi:radical SAM superfamily enzyme YgiQ (UPF0313 family)